MPQATILNVWSQRGRTYIAVSIASDATLPNGNPVTAEYTASVDNSALVGLTTAQKKAVLAAAVKAVRDDVQDAPVPVTGITGTVTV